ncbi:fibronectin type III domain-containing protein [Paenibacillus flagellatus]|uniref:fibronectin type III domain-containing protein n=1 Tax=Paenibacillus flagellatus TaxID=2211139 RepID=UPI0011B708EE|nr:hypothetical protein [Paenibacillus flagellatus]
MKKFGWIGLAIVGLLFSGVSAFAEPTSPAAGLLRGKPASSPAGTHARMTDGNLQTYETLGADTVIWTFSRPVDVTGFVFVADSPDAQLYLFDANGVGVAGAGASTTAPSAPFPIGVSGVKSVRVTSAVPGQPLRVYELDVYGSVAPVVPSAPAGLTASASGLAVELDWNSDPNAIGYRVKRSTSYTGPYTVIGSVYATEYRDTAVAGGVPYYYVVSAYNEFGESANSAVASAVPVQTSPAAPAGLSAVPGDGRVVLQWETVTGAVYYNVKRANVPGGAYTTVATSVYGYYTDRTATNGTTYAYVVTAVNAAGESGPSAPATAMPNAPVPDRALLAVTLSGGVVKEYDLPLAEAYGFAGWYEARANGSGPAVYPLDRYGNNRGPFAGRKEYIAFPAIVSFEINAYVSE